MIAADADFFLFFFFQLIYFLLMHSPNIECKCDGAFDDYSRVVIKRNWVLVSLIWWYGGGGDLTHFRIIICIVFFLFKFSKWIVRFSLESILMFLRLCCAFSGALRKNIWVCCRIETLVAGNEILFFVFCSLAISQCDVERFSKICAFSQAKRRMYRWLERVYNVTSKWALEFDAMHSFSYFSTCSEFHSSIFHR